MLQTLSTEGQTSVGAKPIEFGEQDTPLLGPHKQESALLMKQLPDVD